MAGGDALLRLCASGEVAPDAPLRVDRQGEVYAVFNADGRFFVTADACTHGPGSLSEGYVEGGEVECPFHQGRFDLATGRPTAPPCTEPVRTWTVHFIDGNICIDPAEPARSG
jgi:nitrite reductase/ring-hydroxylating ferredoxin subunit